MAKRVDLHVGRRIRLRRWFIGISQKELADKVGLKFQQIQKYETGGNRVSASKLWQFSQELGVPVSYFFDGLEYEDSDLEKLLGDQNAAMLISYYFKIPEEERKALLDLARILANLDS